MKFLSIIFLVTITVQVAGQELISFVDPLIGTAPAATISAKRHSESASEDKGQTFPGVGRPFGMTQWTPETRTTEIKCISPYYYNDKTISGFRGSHWMSGSCTQDYGSITLMPFASEKPDTVAASPLSTYDRSGMVSTPAYCRVLLTNSDILTELTASVRSGLTRFTFPGTGKSCIYIRVNSDEREGKIIVSGNTIIAENPVHRIYQGRGRSAGFSGWFAIRFDKPFEVIRNEPGSQFMTISFGKETSVIASVGSSFTGADAALANLMEEIPVPDFEKLRRQTEEVWNNTLGKIKVKGGSREDLVKFYTALYHCYQLPRIASDIDGSYPGFAEDDMIHRAEGFDYYDDFSMWDTYRALHPLMTILEPAKTTDMVKSLILKAEQGGWMPIFPAWASYTAAMIGDHASTMIADAWMKGIRDFDIEKAYLYMRKNAFDTPPRNEYIDGKGRRALDSYLKYGYIPLEDSVWDAFHKREQVSRTLEYALDDYALSNVAKTLGRKDDYTALKKRAGNYRNVFDKSTGYVRGRYASGEWIEPFKPNSKASYICEGTPFQYTWYVPHDLPGLIRLMGGKKAFVQKLDEFFDEGYYWHGNETDQQAPFMYAMAGEQSKTGRLTRKINDEEYGTGPGGLSGNEDAGQMSAWLVFSMIGFYPVCPGSGEYILTSPAFNEISIELPGGRHFTIESRGMDENNFDISSSMLNSSILKNSRIAHRDIMAGSTLLHMIAVNP